MAAVILGQIKGVCVGKGLDEGGGGWVVGGGGLNADRRLLNPPS